MQVLVQNYCISSKNSVQNKSLFLSFAQFLEAIIHSRILLLFIAYMCDYLYQKLETIIIQ